MTFGVGVWREVNASSRVGDWVFQAWGGKKNRRKRGPADVSTGPAVILPTYVGHHLQLAGQVSMRDYGLSWELKEAGLDWKERLLERWAVCPKLKLVAQLKADTSYPTEAARVRAFIELGGGSRATYFNKAKKLRNKVELPRRELKNDPPQPVVKESLLDLLGRRYGELGKG